MDQTEIRLGMIVELKSGGPALTVVEKPRGDPPEVYCMWFTDNGELETSYIPCSALDKRT